MVSLKSKIVAVLAVTLIAAGAFFLGVNSPATPRPATATTSTSASPVALYDQNTVNSIYATASPAVVEINVTEQSSGFFQGSAQAQGSGFLVDNNGTNADIVTNNHVVDGATSVQVQFKSGSTTTATILGTDPNDDLAVIQVASSAVPKGVTPLILDNSDLVQPGDMAIAIGSPYGLMDSVTVGIISGLNRSLDGLNANGSSLTGMLQTDAAINPGNSGGPLLNAAGHVIGINTAIETQSGASGIGFAIPSNMVTSRVPLLKTGQQIVKPWLGISGSALTPTSAQTFGVSVSQGVYVIQVMPNSPASQAGLKAAGTDPNTGAPATGGDVITQADGKSVASVEDLSAYLNTKQVGNTVDLTVLRGGSTIHLKATLQAWPANLNTSTTTPNVIPFPNIPNIQNVPQSTPGNPNSPRRFRQPTPTPQ